MKNLFQFILLIGCLIFTPATLVSAESIQDFSINYTILTTGVVLVEENIIYDFGEDYRHGIFRFIERSHPQEAEAWYKERKVDIAVKEVKLNGETVPYDVTSLRSQVEIKIGDPDETITGLQTYQLTYELIGALSYGTDGAELYWNATGNDWQTTIDKVVVTVSGENTQILLDPSACYSGYLGDTSACSEISQINQSVIFSESDLSPGEGLTIATEVDKGSVAFLSTEQVAYAPFGFILATVWIIFLLIKFYRFRREFKKDLPVIAQYEPYANSLPMYAGVLLDNRLDPKDVTAGILYLAEQGFIKIKKTEKKVLFIFNTSDYEITLLRPISEMPTEFLKTLSGLLFSASDVPPKTVLLSTLITKQQSNHALMQKLEKDIKTDIRQSGLSTNKTKLTGTYYIYGSLLLAFCAFFFFVDNGIAVIFYLLFPTAILLLFTKMDRRTALGYEALNHLEGFKLFLSVTDKERFDFHNAPEKSPELFMKYLPYAVAFGVEEKWAKVFAGLSIPNPSWYEGSGGVGAFSATALTSDLASFSSSFSSSSGTSGSSGGGSSGGGGGGGGGGSW